MLFIIQKGSVTYFQFCKNSKYSLKGESNARNNHRLFQPCGTACKLASKLPVWYRAHYYTHHTQ